MQDRITRARLAGDPPDVLISPRLGAVGWFDFHRAAEAIAIGAEATEKAIEAVTEAITALSQPYGDNGIRQVSVTPCGCNPASPRIPARFRSTRCLTTSPIDTSPISSPVGHHRHVAEFSRRHPLHDAGDVVVLAAGRDVAGHHLPDRQARARLRPVRRSRARCRAPTICRRGALPRRGSGPRRCGAALNSFAAAARSAVGSMRDDVAAQSSRNFGGQNCFDVHGSLLGPGARGVQYPRLRVDEQRSCRPAGSVKAIMAQLTARDHIA